MHLILGQHLKGPIVPVSFAERLRCECRSGILALTSFFFIFAGEDPACADLVTDAREAMARATRFFDQQVSVSGSYAWEYSVDLSQRRGEAAVTRSQGWVQPPGTPAIGLVYLEAFVATGEHQYLEAAERVGHALVTTQLESGGWWFKIEFNPDARKAWCYRADPEPCTPTEPNVDRNATTLDDGTTQSSLTFLMLLDSVLGGQERIEEAVAVGLERLRAAQYSNGAWPVRLDRRSSLEPLAERAVMPSTWPRERVRLHAPFYTLNDHLIRDMVRVFLLAHRLYGNPADLETAKRAGEFLREAQLPEPQPAWAQTYGGTMEPVWGRRFEPPGLASRESAGVIETLLDLYLYTDDPRFFEVVPAAVDWLKRVQLADGRWARFYELNTDRPLYMTRDYDLTYSPSDLPDHYGFLSTRDIPAAILMYEKINQAGRDAYITARRMRLADAPRSIDLARLADRVLEIVGDVDHEGRWVEDGEIRSATFISNMQTLATYIALTRRRLTGDLQRLLWRAADGVNGQTSSPPLSAAALCARVLTEHGNPVP